MDLEKIKVDIAKWKSDADALAVKADDNNVRKNNASRAVTLKYFLDQLSAGKPIDEILSEVNSRTKDRASALSFFNGLSGRQEVSGVIKDGARWAYHHVKKDIDGKISDAGDDEPKKVAKPKAIDTETPYVDQKTGEVIPVVEKGEETKPETEIQKDILATAEKSVADTKEANDNQAPIAPANEPAPKGSLFDVWAREQVTAKPDANNVTIVPSVETKTPKPQEDPVVKPVSSVVQVSDGASQDAHERDLPTNDRPTELPKVNIGKQTFGPENDKEEPKRIRISIPTKF